MEMKQRRLKYGLNAGILSASVIGILALAFIGIYRTGWRVDFTANRDFTLAEQTQDILKSIDQQVIIRAFFRPGGDMDQVFIRRKVDDVLQEYAQRSRYVDYRMVDPDLDVEAAMAFGIQSDGTVVFQRGNKRKDIYRSTLFDYPSLADQSVPLFVGESLFTNALISVIQEQQPYLCFSAGQGERDTQSSEAEGLARIMKFLAAENYLTEVITFNEGSQWVKTCDLLIIAGAKFGLHRNIDSAVKAFLRSGKKVVLMLDPRSGVGPQQTLRYLGIKQKQGVVFDPVHHFVLGAHYPAPKLAAHPTTEKLKQAKLSPVLYLASPLEATTETEFSIKALMKSSPAAWGETKLNTDSKPENNQKQDIQGPMTLGAAISRIEQKVESKDGTEIPMALVFGDSNFITNGLIEIQANRELFLNGVAWLMGSKEQITIRPQKPDFRPMVLSPREAQWVTLTAQWLYPGTIFGLGFAYWWRRRRK